MSKQNNINNNCPNQLPISLQSQPHFQDFLPSATSSSHSDNMDYEDTETYTGDYALYQGNLSEDAHQSNVDTPNEQLHTPLRDQVETHTNSPGPLPVSLQTFYDISNPYSDITNDGPTDNHSQHFGMIIFLYKCHTSHEKNSCYYLCAALMLILDGYFGITNAKISVF